jgi:type IVB pilus formation R64 PilN family outer membrane protein
LREAKTQSDQAAQFASTATIPDLPVISSTPAPYLLGTAVSVPQPLPAIFDQPITLQIAQEVSLEDVAGQITTITGMPVSVSGLGTDQASTASGPPTPSSLGGLPPPPASLLASISGGSDAASMPMISVRYSGTLHGLLDDIAARSGTSWRFDNGTIILFRVETKIFELPALAWATAQSSSIATTTGASSSSGSSGSSGGSSTSNNSVGTTAITNTSTTDVWDGLQKTASSVGGGASVIADSSTGTLTATGTPDQLDQISEWVDSLNQTLSKQVAVVIRVYDVKISHETNYGIDPIVAFENAAKSFGLTYGGAGVPLVTGSAAPAEFSAGILSGATGQAGLFKGSGAALQALASLGKVSQVFTRSIVTLNGQPAPLQDAVQTVYLASSSTTSTASVGSTTTLTPGNLTTGFTGSFLPRIVGNRIFLGMNITISSLVSLTTFTAGQSSIQEPTTTDMEIQQSASLKSGDTLMVTGYQASSANTTENGVGSPAFAFLGGGSDATTEHDLVAIVVTASTL